jgi:hypothetical protein
MHLMCTRCIKTFLQILGHTYALYYSFVIFLLAIVLSVLLRYTESDCPFDIFKIFFQINFSGLSINGGYWKNKMRSRKILHRCNDFMRGLSPNFYLNILKDMRVTFQSTNLKYRIQQQSLYFIDIYNVSANTAWLFSNLYLHSIYLD